MSFKWITAFDLDNWADSDPRRAQELLPLLIRKLIFASTDKFNDIYFPNGNSVQFAGYDGTLDIPCKNKFIPQGYSVWEMGTDKDILSKFNQDYEKRTDSPLGAVKSETTFIFVTSRVWKHSKTISTVLSWKRADNEWKDILIFDANTIEAWLDEYPPVAVWIASILGKKIGNFITLNELWDDWTKTTSPNLTENFFLAGRDNERKLISEWLMNIKDNLFIKAESPEEALLFFISTVFSEGEQVCEKLINRCLIVEDSASWKQIISLKNKNIILIPYFKNIEDIRLPQDLIVVIPVSKYEFKSSKKTGSIIVEISKQNKTSFLKALECIGVEISDRYQYITKTKRSFLALYRQITSISSRQKPRWVNKYNMTELTTALLIGGWNEKKAGDKAILSKIADFSYDEYINKISHWLTLEDSPIINVNSNYQVVSIQDMWDYLWDYIVKSNYDKLCECVLLVFGSRDPKYELPEKEWFTASIYGKESDYSKLLYESLIITLIMLSLRDNLTNNFGVISTKNEVDFLVKQILDNIDCWEGWYSIASFLPLLAEASPQAVVTRFEEDVAKDDSSFWFMFNKSSDALFGTNNYTNVLWALEKVVWNKDYAFRAIRVLTKISERNFEYKIANSPLNSLYEIFCLWHPQSALSLDERMQTLKYIVENYPNTAWKLFGLILPKGTSAVCGNIQTPAWRDWDDNIERGVSKIKYIKQVKTIVEITLNSITPEASKWHIVFENINAYNENNDDVVVKLQEQNRYFSDNDRQQISDELRSVISKHRHFAFADWSISKEFTDKLENALHIIEPIDVRIRHKHLFSFHPSLLNPYVYKEIEKYDWMLEEKLINDARVQAMLEIFNQYGLEGIVETISDAEEYFHTGILFAKRILNLEINWDVINTLKNNGKKAIVSSILCKIYQEKGIVYVITSIKENISRFNDDDIAEIFCMLPFLYEIWEEVENYGKNISDIYWRNVNVLGVRNLPEEQIAFVINKLLINNRPYSIMKTISYSDYNNVKVIVEVMAKGIQIAPHKENNGLSLQSFEQHEILEIFKTIYEDKNVDNEKVAQLELLYLPYFRYFGKPLCLFKEISNSPELYVQLVCLAFKEKDAEPVDITEEMRQRAKNAYDILDMFKSIPGFGDDSIDEQHFNNWMNKVLAESKSNGRSEITECLIGELLSHSPVGKDGIWPHEFIRSFLETHSTIKIESNFIIGTTNQRGVHTVTGGQEEKKIAQSYKEQSKKIQFSYPQTSIILKRISEHYLGEARLDEMYEEMDYRYF